MGEDRQLQQLIVYFYPEHKNQASDFIVQYTCNNTTEENNTTITSTTNITEILYAPIKKPSTTSTEVLISESFDKAAIASCSMCRKKIITERVHRPSIPEKVFERNTSTEFEYFVCFVNSPKIQFCPQFVQVDDSKFYQVYSFDKMNFEFKNIDEPCFKYAGGEDSKFFAVYSQSHHLHFCNLRNITVIRKSEFHRNVSAFKILPSTKLFRLTGSKRFVVFFSFSSDLYMEFPKNTFFNNEKITDNQTTILRLKKSTKESFNFIVSTEETLKGVNIFGKYYTEQAYLGKLSSADILALEKINTLGAGLLHYVHTSKEKKKTKYDCMEYACYKADQIHLIDTKNNNV